MHFYAGLQVRQNRSQLGQVHHDFGFSGEMERFLWELEKGVAHTGDPTSPLLQFIRLYWGPTHIDLIPHSVWKAR
jgi:hypothetical protein